MRDVRLELKTAEVDPGMPNSPLTEQWHSLGLINAGEIGVRLIASGVLVPGKSTAMVIGMGLQMTRWTRAEACARCRPKGPAAIK
jgi:hypothetical protein